MNGRADGDDLVGIDALVRIFAEDLLYSLLHRGHAGHATDQNHFVNIAGAESRVLHRLAARSFHPIDQVGAQSFELGPCQLHVHVLRPLLVRGDEG